jgi:alpha-L-arabinofuranosidase B-like protein
MLHSHPGGRCGPGVRTSAALAGRPLRRLLAVLAVLLGLAAAALVHAHPAAAYGSEAPSLGAFANAPSWVTLSWSHSGSGVYYFVIEQESPYGVTYADADKRAWTVTGLSANTTYRYHVCAVYDYNRVCSDWVAVRTMAPPSPGIPAGAISLRSRMFSAGSNILLRHSYSLGEVTNIYNDLDRSDATFVVRPALSGTPGAVSFEALNYRGHYLRHNFWRIKLHQYDGSDLFRKDASFIKRPGMLPGSVRYESVNYPGYYITARAEAGYVHVWIGQQSGGQAGWEMTSWDETAPVAKTCVRWDGPCPA